MSFIERPRTACSLGGVLAAISSLPGVVPIAHTPSGCPGNLAGAMSFGAGNCGNGYCSGNSVPVSNVIEKNIVFGGADRLKEQIASTLEIIDASLYVVCTGCMTEIIADDIDGVISEFQDEGKPVIYVNTPSFEGDCYKGYDILMQKLLSDHPQTSGKKDERLVNLLGIVPQMDPFFRGDLEETARLLRRIGLKVNTFFTPDQNYEDICRAAEASLNIVLSRTYGVKTAKAMEKKHGIPYVITDLPVGADATDSFLVRISEEMGISGDIVQEVIKSENERYYDYVGRITDLIGDGEMKYYTDIAANANNAIPYAYFTERELGWVNENTVITDSLSDKEKEILRETFDEKGLHGNLVFETNSLEIERLFTRSAIQSDGNFYLDSHTPVYVIGSTFERNFATKNAAGALYASYPVYNRTIVGAGYAGYNGGLKLFEDIFSSLVTGK